jgi:hypothetical protein
MESEKTLVRFEMKKGNSALGPTYELNATIVETTDCQWNCRLDVKHVQSKMELSIEVCPSNKNKKFSGGKIPPFYYDIYRSRLQPPRRNETSQTLRVELMIVSRTEQPYAAFHTLGRTNVPQEGAANWLTNSVSESLNKILKKGFGATGEQEGHLRSKFKTKKAGSSLENDTSSTSESNDFHDSESDSDEILVLIP